MCPYFKSEKGPSSSAVENHFKTIKNLVLQTSLNKRRIVEYLISQQDYLAGELTFALGGIISADKDKPQNRVQRKRNNNEILSQVKNLKKKDTLPKKKIARTPSLTITRPTLKTGGESEKTNLKKKNPNFLCEKRKRSFKRKFWLL